MHRDLLDCGSAASRWWAKIEPDRCVPIGRRPSACVSVCVSVCVCVTWTRSVWLGRLLINGPLRRRDARNAGTQSMTRRRCLPPVDPLLFTPYPRSIPLWLWPDIFVIKEEKKVPPPTIWWGWSKLTDESLVDLFSRFFKEQIWREESCTLCGVSGCHQGDRDQFFFILSVSSFLSITRSSPLLNSIARRRISSKINVFLLCFFAFLYFSLRDKWNRLKQQ